MELEGLDILSCFEKFSEVHICFISYGFCFLGVFLKWYLSNWLSIWKCSECTLVLNSDFEFYSVDGVDFQQVFCCKSWLLLDEAVCLWIYFWYGCMPLVIWCLSLGFILVYMCSLWSIIIIVIISLLVGTFCVNGFL